MSTDVIIVFIILFAAVIMFSIENIRNDVASIIIMLTLAWTGVISLEQAFSGFSSNAVMAIIGVMIMGYGIEKTGIMDGLAQIIMKKIRNEENIVIATVMGVTGIISSFMQNIGAVALFLPAVKKIGNQSGINQQRLIMPMAFSGIIGGTITMVASGPLIILNDLLADGGYDSFGMFSVTPIGLSLLIAGTLYFFFFSKFVLPSKKEDNSALKDELLDIYDLPNKIYEVDIENDNKLIGKTIDSLEVWKDSGIHILALWESGSKIYIPWRKTTFKKGQSLAIFGEEDQLKQFATTFNLKIKDHLNVFAELQDDQEAGFAEIILPPDSSLKGKSIEEIALRKNYKIEPIVYINNDGNRMDVIDSEIKPGLKAIVFGRWEDLASLKDSKDFVVISQQIIRVAEISRTDKKIPAMLILGESIVLVLLGVPLALSFLSAAIMMLFTKVILKEELYKAIDWKTVFLLAGLIPLGIAFEKTGAATLVAEAIINIVESWPVIFILVVIGLITSFFSLFMSNVAATVLLVPLILIMGESFGIDPRGLALLVAVAASNAFILPTHQVNAYIMSAGNYKNADFIKAGGLMSIIFLLVSTLLVYFFYI
ncbi:MAG: SLC13 family permease [Erysipelotrichaceae bacterium]|nr:SLC13 family permease [Erysipelotrichaceae bacterium]